MVLKFCCWILICRMVYCLQYVSFKAFEMACKSDCSNANNTEALLCRFKFIFNRCQYFKHTKCLILHVFVHHRNLLQLCKNKQKSCVFTVMHYIHYTVMEVLFLVLLIYYHSFLFRFLFLQFQVKF